jgi:hypothetical protein
MSTVDKPRLAIPAYDIALHSFISLVVDGMISLDPILGQISFQTTGHAGPIRNVPGPNPVDHDLTLFQGEFAIHADVIRGTDVEGFVTVIVELATQYEKAMASTFLQTISDVTEAVGNAMSAEGRSLSWDLILDMLERIEISFDDEGQPSTFQVVMSPTTAKLLHAIEKTPVQAERFQEIMERKKEEWDAQQRARRLPRRDQGTRV